MVQSGPASVSDLRLNCIRSHSYKLLGPYISGLVSIFKGLLDNGKGTEILNQISLLELSTYTFNWG